MSLTGLLLLFLFIYFLVIPLGKLLYRVYQARRGWEQMFRQARNQAFGSQADYTRPGRKAGWDNGSQQQRPQQRGGKKIGRDVGEYVAFEEISDTTTTYTQSSRPTHTNPDQREQQVDDAEWEDIK